MTVTLEITYEATDGVTPSNVRVEWTGTEQAPAPDALVRIIEAVAKIAADGRVSYAIAGTERTLPVRNVPIEETSGFRAVRDIKAGQWATLRAGSETEVVPYALGTTPQAGGQFRAPADEDIPEGSPLLYAAADVGAPTQTVWKVYR